ncbi:hypothetical protein BD779DRAFT_768341 [Infundibulicybe gibba]|nr:hypothetical protein BD779DRAFT_768341 [Infundibulicybe gibba]
MKCIMGATNTHHCLTAHAMIGDRERCLQAGWMTTSQNRFGVGTFLMQSTNSQARGVLQASTFTSTRRRYNQLHIDAPVDTPSPYSRVSVSPSCCCTYNHVPTFLFIAIVVSDVVHALALLNTFTLLRATGPG